MRRKQPEDNERMIVRDLIPSAINQNRVMYLVRWGGEFLIIPADDFRPHDGGYIWFVAWPIGWRYQQAARRQPHD